MVEVLTTIFEDNLVEAGTVDLDAHTPDTGASWSLDPETDTILSVGQVIGGAGHCKASATVAGGYLGYFANPAPAIRDLDMTIEIGAISTNIAGYINLIARYQVSGAAMLLRITRDEWQIIFRNSDANNDWVTVTNGIWSPLLAAGHSVRFRLVSDHMELYRDTGAGFVLLTEGSNANVLVAGDCALAWGSFAEPTGRIETDWEIDKFTVREITGVETATMVFYDNFFPAIQGEHALVHTPDIEGIQWLEDPSTTTTVQAYRLNTQGDVLYVGIATGIDNYIGVVPSPSPTSPNIELEWRLKSYHTEIGASDNYQCISARRVGELCYVLRFSAVTGGDLTVEVFLRTGPEAGNVLATFVTDEFNLGDYWRFRLVGSLITVDHALSSEFGVGSQVYSRVITLMDDTLTAAGNVGIGEGNFVSPEGELGDNAFNNAWAQSFFKVAELDAQASTVKVTETVQLVAYSKGTPENFVNRAWTFTLDGHTFYVISLGEEGTFVYDTDTQQWSQWITEGYDIWNMHVGLNWRGNVIAGDTADPVIWQLDPSSFIDDDFRAQTRIVTGGLATRTRDFIPNYAVRITGSMGETEVPLTVPATTTSIELEYSDDQGKTFVSAGVVEVEEDNFVQVIQWLSLGVIQGPQRIFRITDVGSLARIDGAHAEVEGQ